MFLLIGILIHCGSVFGQALSGCKAFSLNFRRMIRIAWSWRFVLLLRLLLSTHRMLSHCPRTSKSFYFEDCMKNRQEPPFADDC